MTRYLAILSAIVLGSAGDAAAQNAAPDSSINYETIKTVERVAPGLTHTTLQSDSTQTGAPISIHIFRANLDSIEIRPVLAMGQVVGQETTSSLVKRHGALAGVNGGFSYSNNPWQRYHGDPRGFLVIDGKLLSEPNDSAWSVGIDNRVGRQKLALVRPEVRASVVVGDGLRLDCDGLNRERKANECIVYTPMWNRTTLADTSGVEVVVSGGIAVDVRRGRVGAAIPLDGFVVSAHGTSAERLIMMVGDGPGVRVRIDHGVRDIAMGRALALNGRHVVSAGPVLVTEGEPLDSWQGKHWFHGLPFTHSRHPRTAIGWSRDGREAMLVTVDGRQPGHSVGFTLSELSAFMVKQGAHWAYNMDGGGSTTAVLKGKVVNRFSDVWGGYLGEKPIERRRCDALLLFSR